MRNIFIMTAAGLFLIFNIGGASAHNNNGIRGHSGPSFNCNTARIATEYSICESRRLSRLDRRLAYWYGQAKERAGYFDQTIWLRNEQRTWLRERNHCGSSRYCIKRKYRQRIRVLRNYYEHV